MNVRLSTLAVAIGLATLAGCGGGSDVVAVTGKVTFAGGPAPKPGKLTFSPMEVAAGKSAAESIGTATFNEDGAYTAMMADGSEGLAPGKYTVAVECWLQPPSEEDPRSRERNNAVPADYHPEFEVPAGAESVTQDFDVPKKK